MMTHRRDLARSHTRTGLLLLLVLALAATACGQKPGTHSGRSVGFADGGLGANVQAGPADAAESFATEGWDADSEVNTGEDVAWEDTGAETDTAQPADVPASTGAGAPAPGSDDADAPTPSTSAAQEPGASQGGQERSAGNREPQASAASTEPNDRRGVTDSEIRIGVHAPLSGAAPLPQTEFQSGQRMYWEHVGKVDGRDVNIIFRDDQYNPSRATSVCNDLIQREQVFVLIGGGGADQIAACARTAAQQGVPYLSAGVDEGVLGQLPGYFALSMTYPQQATLLAQYIEKHARPADGRVALVRDRTPSYNNTIDRLSEELRKRGLEPVVIPYSNAAAAAQAVSSYETAFVMMAPSQFVQILRAPGGTRPFWVGVGIMMGLNTVSGAACQGGNPYRGMHLSPFPGLNVIDDLDPEFSRAGGVGDIELALWGLNKSLHELLKHMDGDPTRSKLIQILQNTHREPLKTNVYPELRHSPDNHLNATSAHMLEVNCANGRHDTPRGGTFRDSF
jgi:branched-chain amino acid transport system substrate-binding protein